MRTEMWWYVMKRIMDKEMPYPQDPELKRQLSSVRYKIVNSNGLMQLEHKENTKKRLGRKDSTCGERKTVILFYKGKRKK